MSIRADHYDPVPIFEKSARMLPLAHIDLHHAGLAAAPRPLPLLSESETHACLLQAILDQKTFSLRMADGLSSVTFSGCGDDLLVEHSYGSGHRGLHALCVGSWIVWEIFRGCPSATLAELLTYIPGIETSLLQPR